MTNTNSNTQTAPKSYENLVTKKLDKSRIEIVASIPSDIWEKYRKQAIKNINETITVDGFRKGMVPENILISKVGEAAINEEMAELALSKSYLDILIDNKIDAIGKPEVTITKLANGNPLEFKATTAVVPEVKLPDYKKLAQKEIKKDSNIKFEATEKDVDEAILKIRKSRAPHEGHDHEKMTAEEHEKAIMASLPELNDDFVKTLGDFKDVAEFKNKIKELVLQNKKEEAREKLRIRIADSIIDATTIDIPEVMIESELNRTQSQFESDIERMGVKIEDYLKHAKKSLEEIRKEWLPLAERKAKLQLILNSISDTEKIKPDEKDVEAEANHVLEHYKDADKERATTYATTVLTNEKVFGFLETQ